MSLKMNDCCKSLLNSLDVLVDMRIRSLKKKDKELSAEAPNYQKNTEMLGLHLSVIAWEQEAQKFKTLLQNVRRDLGG